MMPFSSPPAPRRGSGFREGIFRMTQSQPVWPFDRPPYDSLAAAVQGETSRFNIPGIAVGMLASSLLFMGQFSLFTYVRPFLETVTGAHGTTISLILLVIGAAGFIGTVLIGRALQRGFYQTLIVIPLLMAVTALALIALGD